MKSKRPSMDGFIPRRTGSELGDLHRHEEVDKTKQQVSSKLLHTGDGEENIIGVANKNQPIGRSDIDESLREIDNEPLVSGKKLSKRQKRKLEKRNKKPVSRLKKTLRLFFLLIIIALVLAGGYLGMRLFSAGGSIFQGSIFDIINSQPLKQDSNGRSNFLVLGTSEDDPGHPGGNLTDSIMVLSIDQKNKNAYIFSVPRDLEVKYGEACISGYSGKINAYFSCVNDGTSQEAEQDRLTKSQKLVGDIFGIDIQYGVHVNYTVMRDVINAIGGSVKITIESRNPNGQMDSNFDWKCGVVGIRDYRTAQEKQKCPPSGHYIDYPNGPVELDAEHALYLAQARGDTMPTYGLEQSNFDREKNQQKILLAIRDKALTVGTLSNLSTVTKLVDALGKNLKTNIQTNEIRTIMELASNIKSQDIHTVSLIDGDNPVMKGDGNPSAGLYSYDDIKAFIKKNLSSDPVVREQANVTVLNGSGVAGAGQTESNKLESLGFYVNSIDNAPTGTYNGYELYVLDSSKTATLDKIKSEYPNIVIKDGTSKYIPDNGTSFILIIGTANQ